MLVRRSPRSPTRGILSAGSLRIPCALGRAGTTIFKREGDGATPVGSMALVFAYRRGAHHRGGSLPRLDLRLPVRPIRPGRDGWCDASTHAAYNRPVRLPFPASAEMMARTDRLYDLVVVLDWNYRERRRGCGSAIFLHIARPGYPPTEGCIAVAPSDMVRLAPFLRPGARLVVRR